MKRKSLLFLIVALFFLLPSTLIFAAETTWPCSGENVNLQKCASTLFTWGIGVGIVLALISFAFGAVMFAIAIENPETKNNAKDRMKNSLLGIGLLLVSFIVLQVINKNLVELDFGKLEWEKMPKVEIAPGVYFFEDSSCQKKVGMATQSVKINPDWKYYKISNRESSNNDASTAVKFGVVLHRAFKFIDEKGACSDFIENTNCNEIGDNKLIDVVRINTDPNISPGNGISFLSKPFGQAGGSRSGERKVGPDAIKTKVYRFHADKITFGQWGAEVTDGEKALCSSFQKCPESIEIRGNYFVAIYSYPGIMGDKRNCQTFVNTIANLKTEPITKYVGTALTPKPDEENDIGSNQLKLLQDMLKQLEGVKNNGNPLSGDLKTFISSLGLGDNFDFIKNPNFDQFVKSNIDTIINSVNLKLVGAQTGVRDSLIDEIIVVPTVGKPRSE